MQISVNTFKQAMQAGQTQIGLWVGLADPYVAEALAGTGFDWLLIDGEHAPNDVRQMLAQLQSVAAYPVHPIVRPVIGDVALIKQVLDIGTQTILVPMVESAEQAQKMVEATRYPPFGVRGVGSALSRSSRWNQIPDYLHQANAQMCVLLQVESKKGLDNLEAIASVDGVDGVFFGPADLAASLGHLGNPGHPDVQSAILDGIRAIRALGKAPGILSADPVLARKALDAGAQFVAVGVDTTLLVKAATSLARQYKNTGSTTTAVADTSASTAVY